MVLFSYAQNRIIRASPVRVNGSRRMTTAFALRSSLHYRVAIAWILEGTDELANNVVHEPLRRGARRVAGGGGALQMD
jgi:hypothetical protein